MGKSSSKPTSKRTAKPRNPAFEWHFKPPLASKQECPICGYAKKRHGLHRRVGPREKIAAKFLAKRPNSRIVKIRERNTWTPTAKVPQLIARAAKLEAEGLTTREIADAMAVPRHVVIDWKIIHSNRWQQASLRDQAEVRAWVTDRAGTEQILDDPGLYLRRARHLYKHVKETVDEELFPGVGMTLSALFEQRYVPLCLSDASTLTIDGYRQTIKTWALITGNPPLERITADTLSLFQRTMLRAVPSRATVRSMVRKIQTLLNKAGPRTQHNRDGLALIAEAPWIRPVTEPMHEPRLVEPETLQAVYEGMEFAKKPRVNGFTPCQWWRALLMLIWHSGMRRGAVFGLRVGDVNVERGMIAVPASITKTRRGETVGISAELAAHLAPLLKDASPDQGLFPWPNAKNPLGPIVGDIRRGLKANALRREFCRLQQLAGIPAEKRFRFKDLRSTHGTIMWSIDPAAAQAALGHASGSAVTLKHYVNRQKVLAEAKSTFPSFLTGVAPSAEAATADWPATVEDVAHNRLPRADEPHRSPALDDAACPICGCQGAGGAVHRLSGKLKNGDPIWVVETTIPPGPRLDESHGSGLHNSVHALRAAPVDRPPVARSKARRAREVAS